MKIKNIFMSALLLAGSLTATAQETKTEITYIPNWYVGAQFGGQYTLGEVAFSDLLAPNAQLVVGRNFNPVLGLRLSVNSWLSKAGADSKFYKQDYKWSWNYVAPSLDMTVNLSNLICGFNPDRITNVGVLAGLGANIAFQNDEAQTVNSMMFKNNQNLRHLWDGSKLSLLGRLGAYVDFKVTDNLALGLEFNANAVTDHYNSKHASNADWYYNALVGLKYTFGKSYAKKVTTIPAPEPVVIEKIVEKIVEKPVPVVKEELVDPSKRNMDMGKDSLRVDIFFTISSTKITAAEALKVKEVVNFMNKYPTSTVKVTGYADKGTGRPAGNQRLSELRRDIVVDALKKEGIKADRIQADAKGDTVQPFSVNEMNRVTICIAK